MGRGWCILMGVRLFLVCLIFNAILLINEEVMNPFQGDLLDFPMRCLDELLDQKRHAFVMAGKNVPHWLASISREVHEQSFDKVETKDKAEDDNLGTTKMISSLNDL